MAGPVFGEQLRVAISNVRVTMSDREPDLVVSVGFV